MPQQWQQQVHLLSVSFDVIVSQSNVHWARKANKITHRSAKEHKKKERNNKYEAISFHLAQKEIS